MSGLPKTRIPVAGLAFSVMAAWAFGQTAEYAHPEIDLRGRLYRTVFQTAPPYLGSGDIAALPGDLRERLSQFLVRRAGFTSAYESKAAGFEEAARDAKKRALERAIVSVVADENAGQLALDFLRNAPIAYEWEGMHEGPVAEAAYAEEFLKRDTSSALSPFLYVFIAHRQRVAFETYGHAKNVEGQKASAKKYRTFLQRARAASDPLYGLIADDLDRQAYLYIRTQTHPRDFDPDG